MGQNSPHPCLCYASHPGNVTFLALGLHYSLFSQEETSLTQNSVYSLKGDVAFCNVGNTATIPQQQPYCFFAKKTMQCLLAYSSFVKVLVISINPMYYTTKQACQLAKTMYKQELDQVTVVLADFTSTKLDNSVETNCSLQYWAFFAPNDLLNMVLKFGYCSMEHPVYRCFIWCSLRFCSIHVK
jgi:hypothetical protein